MKILYNSLCINCSGPISDERLKKCGVCKKCVEEEVEKVDILLKKLQETKKLENLCNLLELLKKYEDFSRFFRKVFGFRMWALQEFWAKRLLKGESFAIVAPTGIGKTTFGIIACLYFALRKKRCYMLVPTSLLAKQVSEKILEIVERFNLNIKTVFYHTGLKAKEKNEMKKRIEAKDFDILITTNRFLAKNFELLPTFDLIFVDDVDSFLKSSKNIDKVFLLLGFPQEIVKKALELEEFEEKFENHGILIVSGATQRAKRTKRIRLFKRMLGFELGRKPEFLRNIKDFYKFVPLEKMGDEVLNIIKNFGSGCLIFVPIHLGRNFAKKINNYLKNNGIKSYVYEKMDPEILEKFEKREIDCLIGIASYASPLARGIDLPERIRYAIFCGVPKFKILLKEKETNPLKLLIILKNIREFLSEENEKEAKKLIQKLKKIVPIKKEVLEKIENKIIQSEFERYVVNLVEKSQNFLRKVLTEELLQKLEESKNILLKPEDDGFSLFVADPIGYIQASGRTSRLFVGGISCGTSILLVDEEKAFNDLKRKCKIFVEEIEFQKFEEKIVKKWFKKVDRDRKIIRMIKEGKVTEKIKDLMKVALMVVESPTKARTIAKFFGKPFRRELNGITIFESMIENYIVNIVATKGHVFDLMNTPGYYGILYFKRNFIPFYDFVKKCKKCGEQFTEFSKCPNCKSEEIVSKENVVNVLREIATEVNEIFIATDADEEGEKIGYDIFCALAPFNKLIYRIEFHEVTKKAISNAIKNKKRINERLVDAQLVRRIEDRWAGFELSKIVQNRFKNKRLSAGRVQTPVLGWIIERCKESRKKKLVLLVKLENGLWVKLEKPKITDIKFAIVRINEKEEKINPQPPYTTDTLLKDASYKLKFSAEKTMKIAQDLFEMGLCTYHRTDSTTVSSVGMKVAKEYIEEKFGEKFKGRSWKKEGAHECIRPTKSIDCKTLKELVSEGIWKFPKKLTKEHFMLYDMVFRRFIASQMIPARIIKQEIKIRINDEEVEQSRIVEIKEHGFSKILPLKIERRVREGKFKIVFKRRKFVPLAHPFTEGEIVAKMKERKIGRPSTYAKIIQTLLERKYIFQKNSLILNSLLGYKVYTYLSRKYGKFVSEELTRKLEERMKEIEEGKIEYQKVLKKLFYEVRSIKSAPAGI